MYLIKMYQNILTQISLNKSTNYLILEKLCYTPKKIKKNKSNTIYMATDIKPKKCVGNCINDFKITFKYVSFNY